MKNEKLEIIESNEFQNLFDKSKKLIDSARSNMGQNGKCNYSSYQFSAWKIYYRAGTARFRKSKIWSKSLGFFVIISDRRIWQRFFKKQCCWNESILHGLQL